MAARIEPPIAAVTDRENEARVGVSAKRIRLPVVRCTVSDYFALGQFLAENLGAACPAEFHASLNDPRHSPGDRLLLRRMGRLVAHVHLTRRLMQFGPLSLPVAGVHGLVTEVDCRQRGLGTHLLLAAEKQMLASGAMIGLLRTRIPHFFRRTGWALCGGSLAASATPHAVLAQLLEQGLGSRRSPRIQVRPWRRWEEEAIARIYRQGLTGSYGLLERNLACWHWLLERRAYDQFYVALDGPDLWDLKESSTQLVGYAAIQGERLVELVTAPSRRKVALELLARACGDAIEQDQRRIVLHAPADSPFLQYFPAGAEVLPPAGGNADYSMARLLDPLGLLRLMCGLFQQRAAEADLARPLELGLLVEGRKYLIEIAGRGRVLADVLGRSYLRLNVADFTRLVLGQLDWDRALDEGRVVPSSALAREAGRVLFPRLPFWRPTLDDVRV